MTTQTAQINVVAQAEEVAAQAPKETPEQFALRWQRNARGFIATFRNTELARRYPYRLTQAEEELAYGEQAMEHRQYQAGSVCFRLVCDLTRLPRPTAQPAKVASAPEQPADDLARKRRKSSNGR